MSEPVRAQVIRSSAAVTRKPLSASSAFMPVKKESSAPTGLPVRGSRIPLGAGATTLMGLSIPFQRPLLPLIYEADCQDAKEHHHRPEAKKADLAENDRPGEHEAHIELHARVIERVESALVGGELLRIRLLVGDNERGDEQREADSKRDRDEDHQGQIVQQQCAHQRPQAYSPAYVIIRPPRTARRPERRRLPRSIGPLFVGLASRTGAPRLSAAYKGWQADNQRHPRAIVPQKGDSAMRLTRARTAHDSRGQRRQTLRNWEKKCMAFPRQIAALLVLAGVLTSWTFAANADDYPARPVKIIVPFGAGGPTDVYARAIGEELRKSLHQPFVMENRPG